MSLDYEEVSIVIKDFIKTYVKNSGLNGVVLGLSGGLDSAVTALLCQQALGKKNTLCIFLPDETTPEIDKKHQKLLVKKYGFQCVTKNINDLVHQIEDNCTIKPNALASGNIKSRLRMILLFSHANMNHSLVCGTSNKSEILLGYFTKYGDGGVDLMPIGDLYKTQVYKLAEYLGIPDPIIKKPPSAGLIKGQTDEEELKLCYEDLDSILMGLEAKKDLKSISKEIGVPLSDVKRICNMRAESEHKRRSALISKIGMRTPGFDWRSPVQEG